MKSVFDNGGIIGKTMTYGGSGIWSFGSVYDKVVAHVVTGAYITSARSTASATSFTFANQNIGTASSNRRVVVTVGWNAVASGVLLSSATIGGISATIVQTSAAAGYERSCLIYATVPTGTTATVVLNYAANVGAGVAIGVFTVTGATIVSSGVFDAHNGTTTTYTTNVSVKSGDYVISALGVGNGVANWTNTTERYTYTNSGDYLEGASTVAATTGTLSIQATGSVYGVLTTVVFSL